MISKVHNKLIGIPELKEINPKSFRDAHKIRRSLLYLSLHNLILLNEDDTWIITPTGVLFLYDIIKRHPQQKQ